MYLLRIVLFSLFSLLTQQALADFLPAGLYELEIETNNDLAPNINIEHCLTAQYAQSLKLWAKTLEQTNWDTCTVNQLSDTDWQTICKNQFTTSITQGNINKTDDGYIVKLNTTVGKQSIQTLMTAKRVRASCK